MAQSPVPWASVSDQIAPHAEAEAEWVAVQSKWTRSWRRLVLLAIQLVYLIYVVGSVWQNSHGAAAVTGYALLAAFAACWLVTPPVLRPDTSGRRFWAWYTFLVALAVAEVPFARAASFVLCVFITILTVARLGARSAPVVAAMSVTALLVPSRSGPGTSAWPSRSTTSPRSRSRSSRS